MNPESLFALLLGIVPPWEVVSVRFSRENKRLDIKIDFAPGSMFPCPACGTFSPARDTTGKTWRHPNFFQYEAYLTARIPRVKCPSTGCGVKQVNIPWARAGSGFTCYSKR